MPQQALHRVTGQGSLGTWCLLAGLVLSWNPAHARTDPDTVLALQEAGAELACAVPAWNESGDPCSAATCGAAGCRGLRRLDLSSNALWGGVPDALGALGALRYLDLGGNALTGTLPAALGRTALQTLLAGGNALTGRLPPFWAYAGNLARVALAGNALTGTLPADWGRLAALRSLDLGGNALTGTLPPAWLALPRLTLLGLFNNCGICGDLPAHAAPASLHLEAAGTALGQPCSPANCHGGDGAGVHSGRISTQTVVLTSVLTLVAVTGVLPTLAILCLRYVVHDSVAPDAI
ncbi:Probably inactive leucine-rich repeat receptor-like protein kinase [Auxenochlorella protothecoides]|uniref:Probably inactive leucine-rich repeat receptor-like protein kinase n=1 Tax=Auxenochlorella protothecoides TaxID=3075 RepID=A0A087SA53_AUXPR|nr:Probably inactive leucine-rich repeat receptor-like protein kinase [Auxenochlorella protothecoides]KFM22607.1 Probably inactive leucine-rich repeat receptor-like protein kinase [Auxenochlorella protothecoides]